MPRHLREHHQLTSQDARNAARSSALRKRHDMSKTKTKDYHKPRRCPVQNCSAVVKRLSAHLQTHRIPQHSAEYKNLLATARKQPVGVGMIHDSSKALLPISLCPGDHSSDTQAAEAECISDRSDVEPSEIADEDKTEDDSNNDTEIQEQITKFTLWMSSPDGGRKHIRSVTKAAAQMYTILSLAKQNGVSWFDRSVLDIFTKFAAEKSYLPATKKSYLGSLKHFCKYALDANVGDGKAVSYTHLTLPTKRIV